MKRFKHIKIISSLLLLVSLVTMSCSNLFDTLSDIKITYTSVLGEAPSTKYVKANYVLTEADLPRLNQKGFSFKDWYIGDTPILPGHVITEDTTLKGKWDSNKYKIKFDANGGKGSLDTINCEFGYKQKLPSVQGQIFREGYYFLGWTTTKDGSGKLYPDGIDVMNLTTENNGVVTLYANWSKVAPNMAKIHFATQLGEKPEFIERPIGSFIESKDLKELSANGYEFLGWYYGSKKVDARFPIDHDMVLTANWRKVGSVANVMFDKSGEVDYKEELKLTCQTEGADIYYTINGETSNRTKYTKPIPITDNMSVEAIAYKEGMNVSEVTTAKFSIKTYTVSFKSNGSTGFFDPIPGFKLNDDFKVSELEDKTLTRDGYDFLGWFHNGEKVTEDIKIEGNTVLVAQWQQTNKVADVLIYPQVRNSSSINEVDYYTPITLTCPTVGATIHYTTDGTIPTKTSPSFTDKTELLITDLAKNTVIKAIGVKEGLTDSDVTTSSYKVKTYTVSVYTNGADGVKDVLLGKEFKKGDTLGTNNDFFKSLNNLKKTNYTLDGFYNSEGKKVDNLNGLVIKENTSLFTKWNQEVVTIDNITGKESLDVSTGVGSGSVDKGDKITITASPSDAVIYYTFDNKDVPDTWTKYDSSKGITVTQRDDFVLKFNASKTGLQKSKTITMNYKVKKYDVTFSSNEDYGTLPHNIKLCKGDKLTKEQLAVTPNENIGFKFKAWKNGTEVVTEGYEITKSLSLVAEWEKQIIPGTLYVSVSSYNELAGQVPITMTITVDGGKNITPSPAETLMEGINLYKFDIPNTSSQSSITIDSNVAGGMLTSTNKIMGRDNKALTINDIFSKSDSKIAFIEAKYSIIQDSPEESPDSMHVEIPMIAVSYEEPSGVIMQVAEQTYNPRYGNLGNMDDETFNILGNNSILDVKEDTQFNINFMNMAGEPIDSSVTSSDTIFKFDDSEGAFIGKSAFADASGNTIVKGTFKYSGSPLSILFEPIYKRVELILKHPENVTLSDGASYPVSYVLVWINGISTFYTYESMGEHLPSAPEIESKTENLYYYYLKDSDFPTSEVQYQIVATINSQSCYQVKNSTETIDGGASDLTKYLATYSITPSNRKVIITMPSNMGAITTAVHASGNDNAITTVSDGCKWSSEK